MRGEGFWGEEGFCWGMETRKNLGKYWGFYRIASLPQLKKAPAPRAFPECEWFSFMFAVQFVRVYAMAWTELWPDDREKL